MDQIELGYTCRVLAILKSDGSKHSLPSPAENVSSGQTIIVHVDAERLAGIAGSAT